MAKKLFICFLLFVVFIGSQMLFSQTRLPEHQFAEGNWRLSGDRLYQNNTNAGLAKVNIKIPQRGVMTYNFNVRFEGGMEDLHGGFGIHVFADSVFPRKSWGCGNSYLLWLNYDADPVSKDIPRGLSAQVYKSVSHSRMHLIKSLDLSAYAYLIENAGPDTLLPVTLMVNGNTGIVRIANPLDPASFFVLDLDTDRILRGDWIALRTNGMAATFGLPK